MTILQLRRYLSRTAAVAGYQPLDADLTAIASTGFGVGALVQTARTSTGVKATGTTVIPFDNTIPQSTEGDQYMSQAITPQFASSFLWVRSYTILSHSLAGNPVLIMALFQDSATDALATNFISSAGAGTLTWLAIDYWVAAATVTARTFKIRAGSASAGTLTFNGTGGNAEMNGTLNSFLEIREIKQ